MKRHELAEEVDGIANDLERAIRKDDGPNRVRLPSGEYLEGEGADMWFQLQYSLIAHYRRLATNIRELED